MSLPIDPNNPNNQQDSNPDTSSGTLNPAPVPPTDNNVTTAAQLSSFYQQQAILERQERERLQRELEEARNSRGQQPPQQRDYSQFNASFLEQPATNIAEIVRREVADTIAPIRDNFQNWMNQQNNTTAYTNLKNQLRGSIPHFDKIERLVDQIMQNATPDVNTFGAAVRMAYGELAMRGENIFSAPPVQNNTPQNIPAQLPPSPPPAPIHNGGQNSSAPVRLTEYENRIARERGMSPEEYVYWRDLPPDQVASSKGWDRTNNKPVA